VPVGGLTDIQKKVLDTFFLTDPIPLPGLSFQALSEIFQKITTT